MKDSISRFTPSRMTTFNNPHIDYVLCINMKRIKFVIEYLFYLFVFLLPWQARLIYHEGILNGGYWEYGSYSLYGTEILLGIIFLLVIVLATQHLRQGSARLQIQWLDVLLISFIVFAGLSILWSINAYLSWQFWLVLIETLALLYLASRIGWNYIKLATAFVLSALIQSGVAIYQFSTQTVWSNKWLGMSGQFVEDGGVSVIEGAGRWLRAYGSLPHPNMLGGFLAISLLFLIGLLFHYQKKYYHPPWKITSKFLLNIFALFGSFTIITYGLLLTFSRSAWLGLIIAILFICIILFWQKSQQQLWFFFKLNIIMLLMVILFITSYGNLLGNRFSTDSRLEAQSMTERQQGWREASEIIKDRPLLGVGLGAYTQALYEVDDSRASYVYQPVHNIDLLVMAELGVIGWLIVTITVVYLLYLVYKKLRDQSEDYELLIITGAFLALLIISLFDHYLWSLYFGLMLGSLVIGLLVRRLR